MSKQSQLETWSKYQQLDILTNTYNSVRNTILTLKLPNEERFEVPYLQGSYGNKTHIWSKSDIDIVVQLDSIFRSNLNLQAKANAGFLTAIYSLDLFVDDLYKFLVERYGYNYITLGNKTIKIKERFGRKAVDIVPCIQYRNYINPNNANSKFYEGIILKNGIHNFPKIHMINGIEKRAYTNNMYKKYIRIFKNFRKKIQGDFPSYFIECLLYNVPNSNFDITLTIGFENIINWLNSQTDWSKFICQNNITNLSGLESTQWQEYQDKL